MGGPTRSPGCAASPGTSWPTTSGVRSGMRTGAVGWPRIDRHEPPDEAAAVGEREAIGRALATLPALQRAVLVFTALDGLTVAEAAVLIERSESATESLLHRARVAFREAYRREEAERCLTTISSSCSHASRSEPPVRPAFAEALGTSLLGELGFQAPGTRVVPGVTIRAVPHERPAQPSRRWLPMPPLPRPSLRPLTLRGLVAAAALVLLLVAVAAATGLVIREWLSSRPGRSPVHGRLHLDRGLPGAGGLLPRPPHGAGRTVAAGHARARPVARP